MFKVDFNFSIYMFPIGIFFLKNWPLLFRNTQTVKTMIFFCVNRISEIWCEIMNTDLPRNGAVQSHSWWWVCCSPLDLTGHTQSTLKYTNIHLVHNLSSFQLYISITFIFIEHMCNITTGQFKGIHPLLSKVFTH